jgi:restriction system protein
VEPPGGPRFVRYFQPVLRALVALGGSGRPAEVRARVIEDLKLAPEIQDETSASGGSRLSNHIAWARFYLAKAGLIDSSERGVWRLTAVGAAEAERMSFARAIELFQDIQAQFRRQPSSESTEVDVEQPPDEAEATGSYQDALLAAIRGLSPAAFERFAQRVLRECGFEEVSVTGRSGDRGIDGIGILQVSPLMSMRVLFQCKRYAGSVGSSEIRDFRGAMAGRTDYGIVLTTGTFTSEARREAVREGVPPIELIDAEGLIRLCEQFKLGLRPVQTFALDDVFFAQFG